MSFVNYYNILGVKQEATEDEIKFAYRKLSLAFHPDKNNGDTFLGEMFKNINVAYKVLSNTEKRKTYNTLINNANNTKAGSPSGSSSYEEQTPEMKKNINKVFEDIDLYFTAENIQRDKYGIYLKSKSTELPKSISLTKLLICFLIFGALWGITKSELYFSKKENNRVLNVLSTYQTENVYIKPDTTSKVISILHAGIKRKAIKYTPKFIKIRFTGSTGTKITGYIKNEKSSNYSHYIDN